MHSNPFLLLTFGLLLATASILASPPPPSLSPPPELASKVVPVPEPANLKPHGFSYYKFHVDRYNKGGKLMPGKKLINVGVLNRVPEDHRWIVADDEDHKWIVADVKAYMDKNVVTNFKHPFHRSNTVQIFLGPEEVNTEFTARFSTRRSYKNEHNEYGPKVSTQNGIGRFYNMKPGVSERKVAYTSAKYNPPPEYKNQYYDLPIPEDLNNIHKFAKTQKRSSSLEEQQVTVGESSNSAGKRRRDSFSSSEPLIRGPELEEEEIRGRVSSTSAWKRRQKSPDLRERDPKRHRTGPTGVSTRQYPVGNPSGRGGPRPQYGSRDYTRGRSERY